MDPMANDVKILTLIGSLRAGSTNRKLAELASEVAPEGVTVEVYEGLREIPFYDEDIDGEDAPAAAVALRDALAASDALLFVTPLYNGGVPSHVKNGLDWLSRPTGGAVITEVPVAAIGTAWGEHGGSFAHEQLCKSAEIAGGSPLNDIQLSIANSLGRFTESHPREDTEVVEQVRAAIAAIAVAARDRAADPVAA